MHNDEKEKFSQKRRDPMSRGRGPGGMGIPGEKAKDFKSAIKRLFSELHGFKAVILVALILAIAGSILSISAPNILSDLTDEISTGLVVNKDNMQELSSKITENFSQEKMADVMPKILQMNLSKDSITQIMSSQIDSKDAICPSYSATRI